MRNKLSLIFLAAASTSLLTGQYGRPTITKGVDLKQKLNAPVPLDLVFHDEAGQTVALRSYFGDKPVILSPVYFTCPSLCPMSLRETVMGLKRLPLQAGLDYEVVVISFDPSDTPQTATEKKAEYGKMFGRAGYNSGWHFLTGSKDQIEKFTSAIGFGYKYDPGTKQFVHAAGILVATPDGRLSRYFYGTDYVPGDLRLALVDASQHRISSPVDYVLQFCYHWDAAQGKYTLAIVNILKAAGILTVLLLSGLIFILMRDDKKIRTKAPWKEAHHVG